MSKLVRPERLIVKVQRAAVNRADVRKVVKLKRVKKARRAEED